MARYKYGIVEWALPAGGRYGCRVAHDAGLEGIQLDLGSYANEFYLSKKEMQRIYLEEGRRWGIEFPSLAVNCLCEIGMTRAPGTKERDIAKTAIRLGIDTAAAMGIGIVMLPTFHDSFIHTDADRALVLECVQEACRQAEDKHITIALENVFSTAEWHAFQRDAGCDNLKIFYDSVNYSVCKGLDNTAIYRENTADIVGIHVKDGAEEMNTHLLGQGATHFYKTVEAIRQSAYAGWIFNETYTDQNLFPGQDTYELLKSDVEVMKQAFES